MKVTGLLLEPGGGIRPEAEAAALTAWRAGAGPYWMDLAGGRPEELTDWLTGLGTLFTGIEGMNFENMPELHYRYAYPIALAGMASVAGGLYVYFRFRWGSRR